MYNLKIIKKLRQRKGMTQSQLADLVGIDRSYLSRLETHNIARNRTPTLLLLEKIAFCLDVCPRDIIRYDCNGCLIFEKCEKDKVDLDEIIEENLNFYI